MSLFPMVALAQPGRLISFSECLQCRNTGHSDNPPATINAVQPITHHPLALTQCGTECGTKRSIKRNTRYISAGYHNTLAESEDF
jgi:hypothetical protein